MSHAKNKRKAAMRRKRERHASFFFRRIPGYDYTVYTITEEQLKQIEDSGWVINHLFPNIKLSEGPFEPDPYRVVYYGLPQPFAASLVAGVVDIDEKLKQLHDVSGRKPDRNK